MKIGDILEDNVTNESFKVLNIEGEGECAWVTLLNLENGLKYSNFLNNLT